MTRASNSFATFDISSDFPFNYYSMKNYLPILSNDTGIPLPIIIGGGCALLLVIIFLILLFTVIIPSKKKRVLFKGNEWINALGEKDNIKEVTAIGSRLSVVLLDKEKINRDRLKELGVSSILVMSNKVTLVIEGQAEVVASTIQKEL